mgnify:FL=1
MCLIGLALNAHPRWALVLAANRDEFYDRPTSGLDWWQPEPGADAILAGRDLDAGGTWLGLSARGRIGMLTNVRDPKRHRVDAPSRGALVTGWLTSNEAVDALWSGWMQRGCNPFNLIGGDLASGRWWWTDDRCKAPQSLADGVHVLSNAALGVPWPKTRQMHGALTRALDRASDAQALAAALLDALGDRSMPADDALPDTGIGLERERALGSVFIHAGAMRYGTRSSTVVVGERNGAAWQLKVVERSFDAAGRPAAERGVTLQPWPGSPATVRVTPLD